MGPNGAPKVAIIAGGSQGIGDCLIKGFLDSGYRVAAAATGSTIANSDDPDVVAVAGDIAERSTASQVVAIALAAFGRIDTLVSIIQLPGGKPLTAFSEKEFGSVVVASLAGFFHIAQLTAAPMLAQGSGHIVTIVVGPARHSALSALVVGGLRTATRVVGRECSQRGVRVNAVLADLGQIPPRPAETRIDMGQAQVPCGTAGAIEIVDAVLYLETANLVTGAILEVGAVAPADSG